MKRFDVYGLGNALLDVEVKVKDEDLAALKIDKGVMTLVDEEAHSQLNQYFSGREKMIACGGSAANTIIAIQQLGCKGYYSCKVANDETGQLFLKDLLAHGVSTNLSPDCLPEGTTGQCFAMITEDAERTMNTHLGITETFSVNEIDDSAIRDSSFIYIEGYLVASPTARQAAIHAHQVAREANVLTAMTLSDPNMTKYFSDGLMDMIHPGVDVLFCNKKEAELFTGRSSLNEMMDYLATISKQVLITLGEKGVLLFDGKEIHDIPGEKTIVVDTLGAGDMFAGTYLGQVCLGSDPVTAARKANQSAAKVVSIFGPRL